MSEPMPEGGEGGGGGFMSARIMGIPAWILLAGAAVLAYWYFSRSSSGSAGSTSGGGGTVTTGATSVKPHAVTINITQGAGNPQPKPPVHKRVVSEHKHESPERKALEQATGSESPWNKMRRTGNYKPDIAWDRKHQKTTKIRVQPPTVQAKPVTHPAPGRATRKVGAPARRPKWGRHVKRKR